MKLTFFSSSIALVALLGSCDPAPESQEAAAKEGMHDHAGPSPAEEAKGKSKSPHTTAMGTVGDTHVHIEYSSPSVRGRTIWGGLVAYDQVWSTGAHNATAVTFSTPVRIAGTRVESGTYAFFTIPGRETWTVILNENYDQHLADDYDEELDVLRHTVSPSKLETPAESLVYAVEPAPGGAGTITVAWDSLQIALPFTPSS
jgi:hypothetical protein